MTLGVDLVMFAMVASLPNCRHPSKVQIMQKLQRDYFTALASEIRSKGRRRTDKVGIDAQGKDGSLEAPHDFDGIIL